MLRMRLVVSLCAASWLAAAMASSQVGAGGSLTVTGAGTVDVLPGGGSQAFLSLSIFPPTYDWSAVGITPVPVDAGGALSHNPFNGCDYGFAGGNSVAFFAGGGLTWLCQAGQRQDAPAPVGAGGAIAAPPPLGGALQDNVFALRGGGTTDFWRYSDSQNTWVVLPSTPQPVGDGGALVQFNSNQSICSTSTFSVAALRGSGTPDFWCYNIDQATWEAAPPTPGPVGAGGALAQLQRFGHIYALAGGGSSSFWRFEWPGVWVPLQNAPGPVGAGGALAGNNWGEGAELYALQGGGSSAVWRYDVSTNAWSAVATVLPVELNLPPDCSGAHASIQSLWPPNRQMVPVSVEGVTDPNDDPVTVTIDYVVQDEQTVGWKESRSCSFCPDAEWLHGDHTALLRSERRPDGNGRVYRVQFSASDGRTGFCSGQVRVCVPHDRALSCVDDGLQYASGSCAFPGFRELQPAAKALR